MTEDETEIGLVYQEGQEGHERCKCGKKGYITKKQKKKKQFGRSGGSNHKKNVTIVGN